MIRFTHTSTCPWTIIRANDKRRARLNALRVVLSQIDYDGKDESVVDTPDDKIVLSGDDLLRE